MWLTNLAINRRVTISMVMLGLMVLGFVGLSRMPLEYIPKIEIPIVTVIVPYPGAGPDEVAQRICKPLEDEVSTINNVDTVESTAQENAGVVIIRFNYGTNLEAAAGDVRDAVNRAQGSFPDGSKQPSLYKLDITQLPIMVIGITGHRSAQNLLQLVNDEVKPRLGQVSGVASVSVTGGQQREIQVLAHKDRLEAVGLSIGQLAQLLQAENLNVPGGNIKQGLRDYAVRVIGEFRSMDEIRNLRLNTPTGVVRLAEIADVQDTSAEVSTISRLNLADSVNISILKQSGGNTVSAVNGVKEKLVELFGDEKTGRAGVLPADVKYVISEDGSEQVLESIADVRDALIWGAVLAAMVAFLFLHNLRATVIIIVAIPISMLSSFMLTGLGLGFSLNMMVMLGLALSVGILIDDSIVVLENISRHLSMGEQPKAAALNGRMEIGSAAVALTMVDVVVYVPVALMGGIVGQFFYAFGITVATCTLFSLLVGFTITPMLAAWWFEREEKSTRHGSGLFARMVAGWEGSYAKLERKYRGLLTRVLRHPWLTVGVGYAALIGLFVMMIIGPKMGLTWFKLEGEFEPASDQGLISVDIETPVGTRLEETNQLVRVIEQRLTNKQKYPEVRFISTSVGQGGSSIMGTGDSGGQYGSLTVNIGRRRPRLAAGRRTDVQLVKDLRRDLADIPSATIKVAAQSSGPGGGADIEFNLLNENADSLGRDSLSVLHALKAIPGLLYVDLSTKPGRPEIWATIDRVRAAEYGLTVAQISSAVRTAFEGDTSSKYRESGDEYDLRVELGQLDRSSLADVGNLFVGMTASGEPIHLRDVADVRLASGPSKVERYNRQRTTLVSAHLDTSIIRLNDAQAKVNQALQQVRLHGSTWAWTGMAKMMQESFTRLFVALILAVLLVYLMTAGLYNSILEPFNILLTLPIAITGGLLGLLICKMTFSIVSMIGIIMLVGIVGKNAILVVDYTNTLRKRGMSRLEALLTAGPHRMRPILMTTMSACAGMLPTALAVNEGSEFRAPMAVVVIFGLLLATTVSLLVIPCSYIIWDNASELGERIGRFFLRSRSRRSPDSDQSPPPA